MSASSPTAASVIRTYLVITALFNGAMALIWGVNTLFLLDAGLDIFQVMLVNGAFSFAQFFFEIPTGVVADTLGRRTSLLLCLVTLFVGTIAYVGLAWLHLGVWAFTIVSAVLGLGFTFYTGAVDAWMVDALKQLGDDRPLDHVFAQAQVVFGIAMLVGSIGGGALAELHYYVPYLLRAALILPTIFVVATQMTDLGFVRRDLSRKQLPSELRRVLVDGVRFGVRNRVVFPLMLASFVAATFSMFGFYSWQRYFLDLLGHERVWVTGVITALVASCGMVGSLLVGRFSKWTKSRADLLAITVVVGAALVMLCGMLTNFYVVVGLYLLASVAGGIATPVKQGYLHAHIPSEQRATIVSLDSLFGDLGGGIGQWGWGYDAKRHSIGAAWVHAGAVLFLGLPCLLLARARDPGTFKPAASSTRP